MIILAVLIPVLGEVLLRNGAVIPEAPVNPVLFIVIFLFLIIISTVSGLVLAQKRSEMLEPLTEVSEYRDHWQENAHPKDIFRSFDMEMADIRYKETPNRVYLDLNPQLNMEGSLDKGSFNGDTIQETQPVYEEIKYPEILKKVRLYVTVYGHALVCLSSVLFFILSRNIGNILSLGSIINSFYIPLSMLAFGMISINTAHFYWAEMNYKSFLINFQGEGTYTESKISVGMAITDSTRSENEVVRTSFVMKTKGKAFNVVLRFCT